MFLCYRSDRQIMAVITQSPLTLAKEPEIQCHAMFTVMKEKFENGFKAKCNVAITLINNMFSLVVLEK